jgi:ankyrin repeat protein
MGHRLSTCGSKPTAVRQKMTLAAAECSDFEPTINLLREALQRQESVHIPSFLLGRLEVDTEDVDELSHKPCPGLYHDQDAYILRLLIRHDPGIARIQKQVGYLLLHPENIFLANFFGDLPLHDACRSSMVSLDVVSFLVKMYPASVKLRGQNNRFPLHWAAMYADAPVVKFLVDKYPKALFAVDVAGKLPIHLACEQGQATKVLQLLIDRHRQGNGGLDVVDIHGKIPLHYAVANQNTLPETVHLLLETYPEGVGVADTSTQNLPLHTVCSYPLRCDLILPLVSVDLFTVLKTNYRHRTPLQLAFRGRRPRPKGMTSLLTQIQDKAIRLIRDTVNDICEERGLPDLVVATICSFALPRIIERTKGEMFW